MNATRLLQHFERISEAPDAVPRLRRFILDLAVRGKLVEQDPKDEPAAKLVERIRAEKARLMKAGQIRESKPLVPVKTGETSYEIPATWKWVPLGETANSHLGGGTPSKSNSSYWDGEIYWASVKDVGKDKYIDATIDRITGAGLADSSSNLIPPGNLIVVTRMGLGKVSINRVPIAINQDLRALSLSSLCAIDYHYIFFKTHGFEGTGLTVKGIKVEELLNIAFPLAPLAEQHRIVARVNELMALCDQLDAAQAERESRRDRLAAASLHRLNNGADAESFREHVRFHLRHIPHLTARPEQIKQLRQTILNLAFCGKLVPQDPNDEPASKLLMRIVKRKARLLGEAKIKKTKACRKFDGNAVPHSVPMSWTWTMLGEITDVGTGSTPSRTQPSFWEGGSIPWISSGSTSQSFITAGDEFVTEKAVTAHRLRLYQSGTLLVALYGQGKTRGQVATLGIESTINQACAAVCPLQGFESVHVYLKLLLQKNYDEVRSLSAGGAQPNLNVQKIKEVFVPLPPLAEQHRIVAKVDELMALCDRLEAQLKTTQTENCRFLETVLEEALRSGRQPMRESAVEHI